MKQEGKLGKSSNLLEGSYGAWIILECHVAAGLTFVQLVQQILGVAELQGTPDVHQALAVLLHVIQRGGAIGQRNGAFQNWQGEEGEA